MARTVYGFLALEDPWNSSKRLPELTTAYPHLSRLLLVELQRC